MGERPQIIVPEIGRHNAALEAQRTRILRGQSYKTLSTFIVTPTRGGRSLAPRVVSSWMGMLRPMNQPVAGPIFVTGHEVGDAYTAAVEMILGNPVWSTYRYLLTLEDDNLPPPDGLLKLYESLESPDLGGPYDVVGGLYWTKGEGGQPMCYGRPEELPLNFIPWLPPTDAVARCNGLGMGFNLFRLEMFRNPKLEKPWFKTEQSYVPGVGTRQYTQDLHFYEKAGRLGYRFACDTRVKVGHYDVDNDVVW